MFVKRRAPALALSPEYLNAAHSTNASGAGSRSSGYLTPPVTDTRSMSPPPRAEADDYLNVHRHRREGRIHREEQVRRHHNTEEYSGEISPSIRSLPSPSGFSLRCGKGESCGTQSTASDGDSAINAPLLESARQLEVQTNFDIGRSDVGGGDVHSRTQKSRERPIDDHRASQSPAMSALRSLTMPHDEYENMEPQRLRRMSTALSNTLHFLKSRTSTIKPPRRASKGPGEDTRVWNPHDDRTSSHGDNRRHSTFRDSKGLSGMLGTPATITLRKASNVYAPSPVISSMEASIVNEDIRKLTPEAPASELLAFYSTPTFMTQGMNHVKETSPESDVSPSSVTANNSSDLNSTTNPTQKRSISVAKFNQKPSVRRSSDPAEAILTFADVYVAPGSFAVEPQSRKASLLPWEALRRISVVHFKARNSVHEIIWREDETTSDSSLSSRSRLSASPQRRDGMSHSGPPNPERQSDPPRQEENETKAQYGYLSSSPTVSSRLSKPQDGLFQWSWKNLSPKSRNTQPAMQVPIGPSRHTHTKSNSDPGVIGTGTFPEPQESRPARSFTSKDHQVTDIQSFPPLRSRSSTSEWRVPLVDFNDPLAGRVQPYQEENGTYSTGYDSGSVARIPSGSVVLESEQLREHGGVRKASSHPHAPPRVGPSGRMGSSIGSSSHMRVLQGRPS